MDKALLAELNTFIVKAKASTYVGSGKSSPSSRPKSHDLQFSDADFLYLDSYFGGTDFVGQEVVLYKNEPAWAMNYYGYILDPEKITAAVAGRVIQESLSALYKEGRFLGGFEHATSDGVYVDTNEGDLTHFTGKEHILCGEVRVYELIYHGGLIRP